MEYGAVMKVVREEGRCEPQELRRSGSILKRWAGQGRSFEDIAAAVRGLRLLIDSGSLSWLPPGSTYGLRVLNFRAGYGRDLYAVALEHWESQARTVSDRDAHDILKQWGVDV